MPIAGSTTTVYPPIGGASAASATDNRVSSNANGSTQGSSAGSQYTVQDSSGTENFSQTQNNMDPASKAALDRLIQQLLKGGTPEMKAQQAQRDGEIATVQSQRAGYSKEAAFGDAQGLISQQMRRTLEQLLPSINRAAEDAGSSGGALRALLLQDAASKAAESSSALGVNTAVQYGGVATGLSQVLENLTRANPEATTALLNALNVSKGATSTTTGSKTTTGQSVTSQNSTANTSGTTQENKNVNTDYAPYAPGSLVAPATGGLTSPLAFGEGALPDLTKYIGTSADNMAKLHGAMSPWASYSF